MNEKYTISKLLIGFALLLATFLILTNSSKNSATSLKDNSLAPFNEVICAPDHYRILDFDKWAKEGSPANVSQVENSSISVIEKNVETVQKITGMLNKKTFTPIGKEEFEMNYKDSNDKVKFWLSTYIDYDDSRKNFYPYNIFIDKDLNLYVVTEKAGDYRYLKRHLTEDEYKFIEESYNTLFKEKE
jgi:hypothetical protein